MSDFGENHDLSLTLNLPPSGMHLEIPSLSAARVGAPFSTLPPPANSYELTADKFVTDCDSEMIAQSSPSPHPKADRNNAQSNEPRSVAGKITENASVEIPKSEEAVEEILPEPALYGATGVGRATAKSKNHSKANDAKLDNQTGRCRRDNSLGLLTKKFMKLIQEVEGGIVDINITADVLKVQKRRIYDITNVLEGIGLIEKTTKSHVRWRGYGIFGPKELDDEVAQLKAEVECQRVEERKLENRIRDKLQQIRALTSDQNNQKHLFLTDEDILSLPCLRNQTVIAIQAPRASSLEVPDPDEYIDLSQKQYRLIVRSTTGQIGVYLLWKTEKNSDDISGECPELLDPQTWTSGSWAVKRMNLSDPLMGTSSSGVEDADPSASPSDTSTSSSGFQKVVPLDVGIDNDYWFKSDNEVSLSQLWSTEEL